jgi:hypothetical protein
MNLFISCPPTYGNRTYLKMLWFSYKKFDDGQDFIKCPKHFIYGYDKKGNFASEMYKGYEKVWVM